MKKLVLAGAAVCALFYCVGATSAFAAEPNIDPKLLSEHIKVLSSDAFEGRGPNTPGETKSIAYISKAFKEAGLQPGGDKIKQGRSWTQNVPLARFDIKGPVAVSVKAAGATQVWKQGEEIAIRAPQTGVAAINIKDAPVVFVGYGVKAPEGRLQGRRPARQDRPRSGQRPRLRDRARMQEWVRLRRQGHDLLRPLDLQV
jgi:hypothetical protein